MKYVKKCKTKFSKIADKSCPQFDFPAPLTFIKVRQNIWINSTYSHADYISNMFTSVDMSLRWPHSIYERTPRTP